MNLKIPVHFCVARGTTVKLDENESIEFSGFSEAVNAKLPLDARGKQRAAARSEWFAALESPLEIHDVVDG